jgi:phytanoyl-CoA hydroxylase
MSTLTDEQMSRYHRDGFLVLPDFASPQLCAELQQRSAELVDQFDPDQYQSVFQTDEQTRSSDSWFLGSGGEVRCFLEAEAVDATGRLNRPKHGSINKIGHAMHDRDDVFDRFSRQPGLEGIAHDIGLQDPKLLQSMYIFKNAHIGGEVTCHQDATFLYTDPITVTGFWFAIEDATIDNGCLWAVPGGHHTNLRKRFVRNDPADDAAGTSFVVADDDITAEGAVPLEATAGTLVLLHGLLPHLSGANRSAKKRDAYSVHVIDGTANYPADNWLQRPDSPLRGFT